MMRSRPLIYSLLTVSLLSNGVQYYRCSRCTAVGAPAGGPAAGEPAAAPPLLPLRRPLPTCSGNCSPALQTVYWQASEAGGFLHQEQVRFPPRVDRIDTFDNPRRGEPGQPPKLSMAWRGAHCLDETRDNAESLFAGHFLNEDGLDFGKYVRKGSVVIDIGACYGVKW